MDILASVQTADAFSWIKHAIEIFLHIDKYLGEIIRDYGVWTYAILFLVIFMETGFVVTPFLPGDSLLFAAGALAGLGAMDPNLLFILLASAAIIGDSINYWTGRYVGPKVFKRDYRFLKREHLEKTQTFYEKYGGKTIIIARFVPIVRTFSPFVAGIGKMNYVKFISYDTFGGFLWVGIFVYLGYFFGNLPFIKKNFSFVIIAIVLISVVPMLLEWFRGRLAARNA